jgi:plastocyanin
MSVMSSMPVSKSQTVSVKVKYIWVLVAVALIILATSPILYYISSSYAPQSTTPSQTGGGGGGGGGGGTANCANPCVISIANSLFGTGSVTVKVGTTVTWVNHDGTQHTSTSDNGVWSSPILNPGQSFSFKFTSAGTYTYHCEIHPMNGVVNVVS